MENRLKNKQKSNEQGRIRTNKRSLTKEKIHKQIKLRTLKREGNECKGKFDTEYVKLEERYLQKNKRYCNF